MDYLLKIKLDYWEALSEAYEYYQTINQEVAVRFYNETDACLQRIMSFPKMYQVKYKNYRQALLHSFPYQIIYEIIEKEVIIFTLFPAKANPKNKPE